LKRKIEIDFSPENQIVGRVEINQGTQVEESTIRGPVSIADNCIIRNSFIGPFSSIGAGTVIEQSSIEHSVILENCRIINIERLADSVLGKNSRVMKQEGNVRPKRLFVGDDVDISL
jgi:glucose-1-phosphate thymidylyltransferase